MRSAAIGLLALLVAATAGAQEPARQADDGEAALVEARQRALAGDAVAQFSLGSLLYWSGGDLDQADRWLRMAAEQAYAPAEFELSLLLETGGDLRAAVTWLERAADHGLPQAQRALGDRYRTGTGVPHDMVTAAVWYQRAAEAGDLLAQYHLGQLCFDGAGLPRDYVRAYVWFDLAAAQTPLEDNWKALLELRDIAAVRMSPDDLETARRLVRERSPGP